MNFFPALCLLFASAVSQLYAMNVLHSLFATASWRSFPRRCLTSCRASAPFSIEQQELFRRKVRQHQASVPRPTNAEQVRSLVAKGSGFGVLSTNSAQHAGFPCGSMVGYCIDQQGRLFSSLSSLSSHTADLVKDGRCSLLVAEDGAGADRARVCFTGTMRKVDSEASRADLRELYLRRHPGAYWVDFPDFRFFVMESLQAVRYVGGFANASNVDPEAFLQASADPLLAFADPVIQHMNADHRDSLQAMVTHILGITCKQASMIALDRLGLTVSAQLCFDDEVRQLRLPFPHPVTDRKAVKDTIVQMAQEAEAVTT